jgi:hypothetical protein
MKSTLPITDSEGIAIAIAMRQYLNSMPKDLKSEGYHPDSNIASAIRVFNRVTNLSHGNHIEYDVNRIPVWFK